MTSEQLLKRFPNASQAFIEANAGVEREGNNPNLFKEVMCSEENSSNGHPTSVTTGGSHTVKQTRKSTEERLNKTEKRWLEELCARGYLPVHIQAVTLQLGVDCRYTPDFFTCFRASVIGWLPTFFEVKGFRRDDAMVKLRVAARVHNWARFILVEWKNKQWVETEIPA